MQSGGTIRGSSTLVADAVGIDRLAAIHSGSGTHQADAAAPMLEADLDGNRRIGARAKAKPRPRPCLPRKTRPAGSVRLPR